jgi:hypothetical protein
MKDACPFLTPPGSLSSDRTAVAIYCRFPNGRVHVPSREEVKSVCAVGRFRECLHYRRHAAPR